MTGPVCVCVISMSSILSAEMIRISAEPQWPPTSTNTTANQPTPRNSIDRTHFWNWPGDHAHTEGVPYIGIYCDATCTTIYYSCRKTVTVVNSVVTCLTSGYKLNWCGIVKRNIAIFQCTDDFLVIDLWCWRHVSLYSDLWCRAWTSWTRGCSTCPTGTNDFLRQLPKQLFRHSPSSSFLPNKQVTDERLNEKRSLCSVFLF